MSAAPERLGAALDRIADALVSLTLERETRTQDLAATSPEPGAAAPSVDRVLLARVGERLDSAIAMLRDVLAEPAAEAPGEREAGTGAGDETEHHHGGDGG